MRVESAVRHWFEVSLLLWEVDAHAPCGALLPLKRARRELASLAVRYAAWRAVDHYVAANYPLACGDFAEATAQITHALGLCRKPVLIGAKADVRAVQATLPRHPYSHGREPRTGNAAASAIPSENIALVVGYRMFHVRRVARQVRFADAERIAREAAARNATAE